MSRTYEALNLAKAQISPTFNFAADSRITASFATLLAEELAQIEQVVGLSIGKLKTAANEGAHAASVEKAQMEQALEALKADAALLESKLQETESALHGRTEEMRDLTAKMAFLVRQNENLEHSLQHAKVEALTQAQRVAIVAADAKTKTTALEAKLAAAESASRAKDDALDQLEQASAARVAELDGQLKDKEQRLADSSSQIGALQSEIARLKDGVRELAASISNRALRLTGDGPWHGAAPSIAESPQEPPAPIHYVRDPSGAEFLER